MFAREPSRPEVLPLPTLLIYSDQGNNFYHGMWHDHQLSDPDPKKD